MKLSLAEMGDLQKVAQVIFESGVCPPDHKRWEQTFAVMMAGAELGFDPIQSIMRVQIVKGKLALTADATIGLCTKETGVCEYFRLVESTDKRAVYETRRKGSEPVTLTYTIEQATRAGLAGSATWKGHTEAMLRARCAAALARAVYPDLVAGIYEKDEVEEIKRADLRGEAVPPPAQLPPPAPANEAKAPTPSAGTDPIKIYSARIAAVGNLNELVATVLELAPMVQTMRDDAQRIIAARRDDMGIDPAALKNQLEAAAKITREPGMWATMAGLLRAFEGAANVAEVKAAMAKHSVAVMKLPPQLQHVAESARKAKLALLESVASTGQLLAAQIEEEIKRAPDLATTDVLAAKVETAAKEGRITIEQATLLADILDQRASAIEDETERAGMRAA